ncbi:MAG: YitT family protein [Oscillospiraceae bacterium]|nr:YitT family protein [Oscillospiraceae bacterium]
MAKIREYIVNISVYALGSLLFSVSINIFSAPNDITSGGITGISIMANYLFHIPIGTLTFALNIPLFIWGMRRRGRDFMIKTILATFISSAVIDISAPLLPVYRGDLMLASIFAGVLSGAGLGIIFLFGGTTGGTDLAASLISYRLGQFSMGKLILFIDSTIILISAFVYRSIETPMYAAISVFISTKIIDAILYGKSEKMLLIISSKYSEIADSLLYSAKRGVTLLHARGGYTGRSTMAVLCAAERYEAYKIYTIIHKIDKSAFVVTLDTAEISGNGFREPNDF